MMRSELCARRHKAYEVARLSVSKRLLAWLLAALLGGLSLRFF